ncbi:MAG: hypothetical protein U1G07_19645 [Verrucomicrobiota bacterium]
MNRLLLLVFVVALLNVGCRQPRNQAGDPVQPPAATPAEISPAASIPRPSDEIPGGVQLQNTPVAVALDIYREYVGKELVLATEVKASKAQISLSLARVTRTGLIKFLEKALREQAGLVITPMEDKLSVSVAQSP